MKSMHARLAVGAAVTALVATGTMTAQAGETPLPDGTTRLSGSNRYLTSAAISGRSFTSPVDAVFVATGDAYPDALSGGPAAARLGGPVLLVGKNSISDAVRDELARLAPGTIYVLGGSAVISDAVVGELGSLTDGKVTRISGTNRFETARAVSQLAWPSSPTVFLSSGRAFPDALGGGAAAAHADAPLLLTEPGRLSAAARDELVRLAPSTVYVLGGTAAVSGGVVSSVKSAVPGARVVRLSGSNRYSTSARIADVLWPGGSRAMFFATGQNFPDALSGTPAAHVNDAPLLLSRSDCLTTEVIALRDEFAPSTTALLGGTAAIADGAVNRECGANRYTGQGDDVITITKPGGSTKPAIVTATHQGSENFIVWGMTSGNVETDLLVNAIGDYSGNVLLDDNRYGAPSTKLEISADGRWTVSVKKLSAARALKSSTAGTGDEVLSWTGATRTVDLTHVGSENFIVWAHDANGDWIDLVANEIGNYSGTVILPAGTRYVTVEADGDWSIRLR